MEFHGTLRVVTDWLKKAEDHAKLDQEGINFDTVDNMLQEHRVSDTEQEQEWNLEQWYMRRNRKLNQSQVLT